MIDRDFKQLVAHMRLRQKEYFRTRDNYQLQESKKLEIKVDNLLAGIVDLFDDKEEQKRKERRKVINDFIDWKLIADKDTPELMKKSSLEIAEMFLFEY